MKLETILTIIIKNIQHWFFKITFQNKRIVPYKLLLQTTNDCNSRCEYCHIWKINKENPELKKEEVNRNNIEELFKSYGSDLLWLALSGGEITMSGQTEEFIDLAYKYCPNLKFITFTTNGLLPKKAEMLAKKIRDYGIDSFVTISLDGDEETHDHLRGIKGNYAKAYETKDLIEALGVKVHFGITLAPENNDFILNQYFNYRKNLKSITFVHRDGIYHTKPDSRKGSDVSNESLTILSSLKYVYQNYQVTGLADWFEKIYIKLGILFLKEKKQKNLITCDAGSSSLHIFPNGDVAPCMYLPASGSIKENSLENILQSQEFDSTVSRAKEGNCPKCWLNCYAPHSMMQHPFQTLSKICKPGALR